MKNGKRTAIPGWLSVALGVLLGFSETLGSLGAEQTDAQEVPSTNMTVTFRNQLSIDIDLYYVTDEKDMLFHNIKSNTSVNIDTWPSHKFASRRTSGTRNLQEFLIDWETKEVDINDDGSAAQPLWTPEHMQSIVFDLQERVKMLEEELRSQRDSRNGKSVSKPHVKVTRKQSAPGIFANAPERNTSDEVWKRYMERTKGLWEKFKKLDQCDEFPFKDFEADREETIFVQISSYRDPELPNTIADILKRAKAPERLRFGIHRQYHPDENVDPLYEWREDSRFRIVESLWNESQGVGWSRHLVNGMYQNETFALQVDSHNQFTENWDQKAINQMKNLQILGFRKPILTVYAPHWNDSDPSRKSWDFTPTVNVFHQFSDSGPFNFHAQAMQKPKKRCHPLPTAFYSAHFAFTPGQAVVDFRMDPQLYFEGEEPAQTIRAFTHGYDLFAPHQLITWHLYTRAKERKHWNDNDVSKRNFDSLEHYRSLFWPSNNEKNGKKESSNNFLTLEKKEEQEKQGGEGGKENDKEAANRVGEGKRELQQLSADSLTERLREMQIDEYGPGKERSVTEFELFSGLMIREARLLPFNVEEPSAWRQTPIALKPPIFDSEREWVDAHLSRFELCFVVDRRFFSDAPLDDYTLVLFALQDGDKELYRKDLTEKELETCRAVLKAGDRACRVCRQTVFMEADLAKEYKYVLWPATKSHGWRKKLKLPDLSELAELPVFDKDKIPFPTVEQDGPDGPLNCPNNQQFRAVITLGTSNSAKLTLSDVDEDPFAPFEFVDVEVSPSTCTPVDSPPNAPMFMCDPDTNEVEACFNRQTEPGASDTSKVMVNVTETEPVLDECDEGMAMEVFCVSSPIEVPLPTPVNIPANCGTLLDIADNAFFWNSGTGTMGAQKLTFTANGFDFTTPDGFAIEPTFSGSGSCTQTGTQTSSMVMYNCDPGLTSLLICFQGINEVMPNFLNLFVKETDSNTIDWTNVEVRDVVTTAESGGTPINEPGMIVECTPSTNADVLPCVCGPSSGGIANCANINFNGNCWGGVIGPVCYDSTPSANCDAVTCEDNRVEFGRGNMNMGSGNNFPNPNICIASSRAMMGGLLTRSLQFKLCDPDNSTGPFTVADLDDAIYVTRSQRVGPNDESNKSCGQVCCPPEIAPPFDPTCSP
uniref:Glycosyltransferase 2-like domain-containing protein n=1 Tax=Chromera velia CCMP2878 TaxID=1169474 RepID=A0A0G4GVA1_9ALVE|eukprot:Cvel_23475.t1-p1 / transcript=Cvel_23475.t1 / gene=Cvel_23475 / organism=Chromera_velia_CCMP2878 / gene_product=[Skp1-protein]-hydroxyproline, putative / transcript_product=[Skp1-protein]-hydroxyproline, putative / location=Cvel_scaffold2423:6368-24645(-) / protein_length=1158 / sequence_SO=supercontig / SO=protein_coding / is_pseudo=false